MLEVSSTEITFDNVDGNMKPFKLDIRNTTHQFIGYKIKSTKPDIFQVKPIKGILSSQQKQVVEFSVLPEYQLADAKQYVDAKFQIQVIKVQENLSLNDLDFKFKTETKQDSIKLLTSVYKQENGKKTLVQNDKMTSSIYRNIEKSKSEVKTNPEQELVQKIFQQDKEITELKIQREQIFNKTQQPKSNPSKISQILKPVVFGVILSLVYQYYQK
ncbi:hypothetical protein pb186bvf_002205 [Paramecium bursaria]